MPPTLVSGRVRPTTASARPARIGSHSASIQPGSARQSSSVNAMTLAVPSATPWFLARESPVPIPRTYRTGTALPCRRLTASRVASSRL